MPSSSKQGIGQYRFDSTYKYLKDELVLKPRYYIYGDSISYRDIYFDLRNDNNGTTIKSSNTYFLNLKIPQHIQYTTVVRVKLCAENTQGNIDKDAFQEIRELTIPPSSNTEKLFESVIIYIDPDGDRINPAGDTLHADIYYPYPERQEDLKANYIYYRAEDNEYFRWDGSQERSLSEDNYYSISNVQKTWMAASSMENIVSFDMVFSPKYNLSNGYPFLLLEIDRTGSYQSQIQYKDNNNTYNGTYLNIDKVNATLYTMANLLENTNDISSTPIKTGKSPNVLNHIAVWGHPELMMAINGEEIKIGPTGFYELNDFTIKSLGIVASDANDRFTIDYQYTLS